MKLINYLELYDEKQMFNNRYTFIAELYKVIEKAVKTHIENSNHQFQAICFKQS